MKKSEELRKAAAEEDNDLKAVGLMKQSLREERHERFAEEYLPKLQEKGYPIRFFENQGKYAIDTKACNKSFGIVDYYPKANNLLIRKDNKWFKPGLKWMIENLL